MRCRRWQRRRRRPFRGAASRRREARFFVWGRADPGTVEAPRYCRRGPYRRLCRRAHPSFAPASLAFEWMPCFAIRAVGQPGYRFGLFGTACIVLLLPKKWIDAMRLLNELGLTYPQYLVLAALYEQDDQTVGSLSDKL